MKNQLTLLCLACLVGLGFAAKAPTHHSLRAESMGNAHVAVVDDKEAIYFNYAGLSQINRLGNYKIRPEQGYYPRNFGDMRLNLGGAGPFETYFSTYNEVKSLQGLYQRATAAAQLYGLSTTNVVMDSLAAHPELANMLNSYDHKRLDMRITLRRMNSRSVPYLLAQAGIAYGFTDRFSVGIGGKIVKRQKVDMITMDIVNYNSLQDTLEDRYHDATDHLFDFSSISAGIDIGVLYQLTREVRLGASLNDIYFKELAGDRIIPNFTMGVNYSPRFFNKNSAYARKFNIACDYANMFYSENNYLPLSHVNFGVEVEQTLLAWPGYNNELRGLAVRLAGGFRGGYPTAGVGVELLRVFTLDLVTWAEELGYYTGQDEERVYMAQISLGF